MNKTNITTDNSVTNTWSIQQTPMFHGCTITWYDVKICVTSYFMYRVSHEGKYCTKFLNQYNFICSNFYKLYKLLQRRGLKTFDIMGPHQGFVYMLLTFELLKLFRKPVVLLCDWSGICDGIICCNICFVHTAV
jgi:hypothetical protein